MNSRTSLDALSRLKGLAPNNEHNVQSVSNESTDGYVYVHGNQGGYDEAKDISLNLISKLNPKEVSELEGRNDGLNYTAFATGNFNIRHLTRLPEDILKLYTQYPTLYTNERPKQLTYSGNYKSGDILVRFPDMRMLFQNERRMGISLAYQGKDVVAALIDTTDLPYANIFDDREEILNNVANRTSSFIPKEVYSKLDGGYNYSTQIAEGLLETMEQNYSHFNQLDEDDLYWINTDLCSAMLHLDYDLTLNHLKLYTELISELKGFHGATFNLDKLDKVTYKFLSLGAEI